MKIEVVDSTSMDFGYDVTPNGLKTPEGVARAANALEALNGKNEQVALCVGRFMISWESELLRLVRENGLNEMSDDLDSLINADKERVKARNELSRAVHGR